MEVLPKDTFLEYNEDTLEAVRKLYNLDKPGAMEGVVNILEEWVKEQPHFNKTNFERRYLETTIILSKGSIERAKSRLDRGCTIRTLMPHVFQLSDPDIVRHLLATELKDMPHSLLPKMTEDNTRVYIARIQEKKFEDTAMANMVRILPYFVEYVRRNDYAQNYTIILDYMDANMMEVLRVVTVPIVQDIIAYLLDCSGFRLKAVYLISSSKLIEMLLTLYKSFLSAKLAARLHVLKDRDCLKDKFDKNILPEEYGGHEKPLKELQEKFLDAVTSEEHIKYLKEINSANTNEERRQSSKFNEEYMGMPGSFRKLNVD